MKIKQLIIVLPLITCFLCAGCNHVNNKNSEDDLVLPGKDRIWWTEGFNDLNEASKFLIDLRNTQKNGEFNFGLSSFNIPKEYICRSMGFYGHIDGNFSNKEDIFNSTYDYFWIKHLFVKNTTELPVYNQIYLYFYPFYGENSTFSNNKIEYIVNNYGDGGYIIYFIYNNYKIMELQTNMYSCKDVIKDNVIYELTENFMMIS